MPDCPRHGPKQTNDEYAIPSLKYLKDLESILIRVASPKGNRQLGGFGKDKNLRKKLQKEIISSIKADFKAD
jgi:hypothetical protein